MIIFKINSNLPGSEFKGSRKKSYFFSGQSTQYPLGLVAKRTATNLKKIDK